MMKQAGFSYRDRRYEGRQCAIEGIREWAPTLERDPKKIRGFGIQHHNPNPPNRCRIGEGLADF